MSAQGRMFTACRPVVRRMPRPVPADLPASVRRYAREVCEQFDVDPSGLLTRLDRWAYTAADLRRLLAYSREELARQAADLLCEREGTP